MEPREFLQKHPGALADLIRMGRRKRKYMMSLISLFEALPDALAQQRNEQKVNQCLSE